MEKDEIVSELRAINARLTEIERYVSMGRGAVGMFLSLLALIGTVCGIMKVMGK